MCEQTEKVYITDKYGGYYKLDECGQLTRAVNKESAYKFSAKDASSRIGTGKKARLYSTELVTEVEHTEEPCYDAQELSTVQPVNRYEQFGEMVERLVHEMSDVSLHIEDQKEYLVAELSRVDQKICDVLHFLEFNASQPSDFTEGGKLLKDFRCKRREIKDDLDRIKMLQTTFMDSHFSVLVNESMRQMEDMKDRHYVPRQLPELFVKTAYAG